MDPIGSVRPSVNVNPNSPVGSPGITRGRGVFALLLAVAIMFSVSGIGCAKKRLVRVPNLIYIYNLSETAIQSIRYERCATPGSGHIPIPADRPIRPGEVLTVAPIRECVDLIAVDIEGEVVGHLGELRMQPGMTWRIGR